MKFRTAFLAITVAMSSVSSAWASPFTPSSITGLDLWLDANASLNSGTPSNGSSVALWVDRSGQGRDASQATAGNQPVFVSDNGIGSGMPAIRFDGSNDSMSFTQFLPRSAFIVNKTTGGAHALAGILGKFPNGTGIRRSNSEEGWHHPGDGNVFTNPAGSGFFINGNAGHLVNKHVWHVMSAIRSTASTVEFNSLAKAYTGREWAGDIAEVLVYDSTLSESDRQKVEGYLAHKWGLASTLPSNHPYLSSAPSTNSPPTGGVSIVHQPVNPSGSIITVSSTIQAAIDLAQANDMVVVPAGSYFENITIPNSPVFSLVGAGPELSIIRGVPGAGVPVVKFLGGSPTMEGFTVTDGNTTGNWAGAGTDL